MSNAKRRHRRRYRKMRCIVLFLPGKSPEQKIGDPIPKEVTRDYYRLGKKGRELRDSHVIRMGKA